MAEDRKTSLEEYRQLMALIGFYKAEEFLRKVIEEDGPDAEVAPQGQVLDKLARIEFGQ